MGQQAARPGSKKGEQPGSQRHRAHSALLLRRRRRWQERRRRRRQQQQTGHCPFALGSASAPAYPAARRPLRLQVRRVASPKSKRRRRALRVSQPSPAQPTGGRPSPAAPTCAMRSLYGGCRIMGSVMACTLLGRSNFISTYSPCGTQGMHAYMYVYRGGGGGGCASAPAFIYTYARVCVLACELLLLLPWHVAGREAERAARSCPTAGLGRSGGPGGHEAAAQAASNAVDRTPSPSATARSATTNINHQVPP